MGAVFQCFYSSDPESLGSTSVLSEQQVHNPEPRARRFSHEPKLSRSEIRKLRRKVSFSEAEINDWWADFLKSAKRKPNQFYLTEREFVKVYKSVFRGNVEEFARHVFRTFDSDRDGKVDFGEFIIGMSVSGSDEREKKLKWAFQVYDIDRSGRLTRAKMVNVVRSVYRMISPDDVLKADTTCTPETIVDNFFREMGKSSSDVITWQEFHAAVNRNPVIVNLLQCSPSYDVD